MGVQVIIHGYIECPFDIGRHTESTRVVEHNRTLIQSLTGTNEKHKFVQRDMFTVHPPKAIVPCQRHCRAPPGYDSNFMAGFAAWSPRLSIWRGMLDLS